MLAVKPPELDLVRLGPAVPRVLDLRPPPRGRCEHRARDEHRGADEHQRDRDHPGSVRGDATGHDRGAEHQEGKAGGQQALAFSFVWETLSRWWRTPQVRGHNAPVATELQAELRVAAERLRDAADHALLPSISAPLEALQAAAVTAASAWSGSSLGYHSRVYYADFRSPPVDAHWSVE